MVEGSLRGFTHVSLSVSDLDRSRHFDHEVLGLPLLADTYEGTVFDGRELMLLVGRTALCLQQHRSNPGEPFEPSRTGLDHLSFGVPSIEDLRTWAERLSSANVQHSGIKPLPGFGDFIELCDPDGIQLELHCLPAIGSDQLLDGALDPEMSSDGREKVPSGGESSTVGVTDPLDAAGSEVVAGSGVCRPSPKDLVSIHEGVVQVEQHQPRHLRPAGSTNERSQASGAAASPAP